jgi:uncharacterized protein (DUF362 family)/NAD-dependent dihydropyrimidine dehydrogenase PreA subunit
MTEEHCTGVEATVSVAGCSAYEPEKLRQALRAALEPLGGMARYVRQGMKVLLKPNLLAPVSPEQAVCTHPALVAAVAELVRAAGGQVTIGDSPGGPVEITGEVWRTTGLADEAARCSLPLVSFQDIAWRRAGGGGYAIARPVVDADLVINLPKLKTHGLVRYTGAIKNMFGVVPGQRKRELHVRAPGVTEFSRVLVDVCELARPGLTIMDAVLGMEGNGPGTSGKPRLFGCLIASADPVALDAVAARAMGYAPGSIAHIVMAAERGLGVARVDQICVAGDRWALEFGAVDLPAARWYLNLPAGLTRPLEGLLRAKPSFSATACRGCGRCSKVCPQDALTPGRPPLLDRKACVGCLCCAEVCPYAAIEPRMGRLARLAGLDH